jgi:hypothetical protein
MFSTGCTNLSISQLKNTVTLKMEVQRLGLRIDKMSSTSLVHDVDPELARYAHDVSSAPFKTHSDDRTPLYQFAIIRQGDIRITGPMKPARNYPWDKKYQNVAIHEQSIRLTDPDIPCVVRTYNWQNEKGRRTALKVHLIFSINA